MSANTSVYKVQGGAQTVVATGGSIRIAGGSILPASGTKASHIADLATNVSFTTAHAAAFNGVLAALEGVGILATS